MLSLMIIVLLILGVSINLFTVLFNFQYAKSDMCVVKSKNNYFVNTHVAYSI